jgi:hypothetical protein
MFYMALWAAEQEAKILAPFYYGERKKFSELGSAEQMFFGAIGSANLGLLVGLGSMPYAQLAGKHTQSLNYLAELSLEARYIRTGDIAFKPGYAKRGLATRAPFSFKRLATRKLAARAGARFIPYLGVAFLMWDAWNVGKWIGHKLFDD